LSFLLIGLNSVLKFMNCDELTPVTCTINILQSSNEDLNTCTKKVP